MLSPLAVCVVRFRSLTRSTRATSLHDDRPEQVVGWYHSHPGFGCWLSSVDVNTQQVRPCSLPKRSTNSLSPPSSTKQAFEQLNPRAVAVVVDPIQSVKGKVVIDAFRSISPQNIMLGMEPRQSTSNVGHLGKPSIQVRAPS